MRLDLARPFVALAVKRRVKLNRGQRRLWNRDGELRDAVTALAMEKYEKADDGLSAEEDEDEESGLLRFLNWLIEHQDEIKALIEMIMSLFNDAEGRNVV